MKGQLQRLGISYAWERELATCDAEYYKWNQWLFIRMFEKGLAYRRKSSVNWCPVDNTVLANEQVVDGGCWRCGTPVETRDLEQWFFRITAYADELLDATERSGEVAREGADDAAELDRALGGRAGHVSRSRATRRRRSRCSPPASTRSTARRSCCSAPSIRWCRRSPSDRPIRRRCASRRRRSACRTARRASAARSRSRASTPASARSTRSRNEPVPVWVANFVLGEYGTGAIMAVPAHDQRDFEFATQVQPADSPVVVPPPDDRQCTSRAIDADEAGTARRLGCRSLDRAADAVHGYGIWSSPASSAACRRRRRRSR